MMRYVLFIACTTAVLACKHPTAPIVPGPDSTLSNDSVKTHRDSTLSHDSVVHHDTLIHPDTSRSYTRSDTLRWIDTVTYDTLRVRIHGVYLYGSYSFQDDQQGGASGSGNERHRLEIDAASPLGTRIGRSLGTYSLTDHPGDYHSSDFSTTRDTEYFVSTGASRSSRSESLGGWPHSESRGQSDWHVSNVPFTIEPDLSLHGFIDLSHATLDEANAYQFSYSYSNYSLQSHYTSSSSFSGSTVDSLAPDAYVEIWVIRKH